MVRDLFQIESAPCRKPRVTAGSIYLQRARKCAQLSGKQSRTPHLLLRTRARASIPGFGCAALNGSSGKPIGCELREAPPVRLIASILSKRSLCEQYAKVARSFSEKYPVRRMNMRNPNLHRCCGKPPRKKPAFLFRNAGFARNGRRFRRFSSSLRISFFYLQGNYTASRSSFRPVNIT